MAKKFLGGKMKKWQIPPAFQRPLLTGIFVLVVIVLSQHDAADLVALVPLLISFLADKKKHDDPDSSC
jgi:hypothetical protein